jgi:isocitrate dehydrogenase
MVIFRENTEDIYAGIEYQPARLSPRSRARFLAEDFPKEFAKIRFGDAAKQRGVAEAARIGRHTQA